MSAQVVSLNTTNWLGDPSVSGPGIQPGDIFVYMYLWSNNGGGSNVLGATTGLGATWEVVNAGKLSYAIGRGATAYGSIDAGIPYNDSGAACAVFQLRGVSDLITIIESGNAKLTQSMVVDTTQAALLLFNNNVDLDATGSLPDDSAWVGGASVAHAYVPVSDNEVVQPHFNNGGNNGGYGVMLFGAPYGGSNSPVTLLKARDLGVTGDGANLLASHQQPAGNPLVNGDFQTLMIVTQNSGGVTAPAPSGGWTLLGVYDSGTSTRLHVFYRVYNTTTMDNVTVSIPWGGVGGGEYRVYRGAKSIEFKNAGTGLVSPARSVPANGLLVRAWNAGTGGGGTAQLQPDAGLRDRTPARGEIFNWYGGHAFGQESIPSGLDAPARTAWSDWVAIAPQWANFEVLAPPAVPNLYLGSSKVDKLYLGSNEISTAFLGASSI